MAKVRVSTEVIAEMLFGYSQNPVTVVGATYDPLHGVVTFDISGPDVPDVEEVTALVTVQQNRRRERLHSMEFKPK